jgi:hypothetical protein
MAGPVYENPNTNNYMIGKGILYIAKFGATAPGVYEDVGNCTKFEFEMTEEEKEHFASRSTTKEQDAVIVIQTGYNVNFELDEVSIENLRRFIKGTVVGGVLNANAAANTYYALKFVSDNPAGPNGVWEFWKCKITPNGAFALIGDDWAVMSYTGKGMADRLNHASCPFFQVTFATVVTTTSTTTTTTTGG